MSTYEAPYPDFPFYEGPFDPKCCPDTRSGHETLHTCPPSSQDTCPAPQFWEDHCHIYPWLQDYLAGDNAALEPLLAYYEPRVRELIQNKYAYLDFNEAYAMGMEALLRTISKYDISFEVPMQAYIRLQMPRRMVDVLRDDGLYKRPSIDFNKRLSEVMEANPDLSEEQAAEKLIGAPDRRSELTRKRVEDLMRDRRMRSAHHLEYIGAEGREMSEYVLVSEHDVEDEVLAAESAHNAQQVVSVLTANLETDDVELVMAYTAGGVVLTEWADAHAMARKDASARAQSLISRLQARAADLLNVSRATLAARDGDLNEVKFLEAMHTGRITPDGHHVHDLQQSAAFLKAS